MSNNWSTSNYRQRKAARLSERPAQWVTNPETQERFFIRPIGAAALALAGYLPSALKAEALEGWKQHGVEVEGGEETTGVSPQRSAEVDRSNRTSAKLIYEACLIPTLVAVGEDPDAVLERALKNCELAFANDEEWKAADEHEKLQRASDVVLPMEELEESDIKFILSQSYGYVGSVPMRGGQVTNVTDLKSLRKTPGRRARTGTGG